MNFLSLLCLGCGVKQISVKNDFLDIAEFKMKKDLHYANVSLIFREFENKNQKIPAYYHVNGVIFQMQTDTLNVNLNLKEEGDYKFKVGSFGKEEVSFNLLIELGDSLLVNVFLKDDDEILN